MVPSDYNGYLDQAGEDAADCLDTARRFVADTLAQLEP
jgi:hypothetical protein